MSNLRVTFSNFEPLGDHLCDGKSFDVELVYKKRDRDFSWLNYYKHYVGPSIDGVATYELEWRGGKGYRWLVTSYSACLIWDGIEHTLSVDLFGKADTHDPRYSPPRERLFTSSEAKRELKKKILQLLSELPRDAYVPPLPRELCSPPKLDLKGAQRRIIVLEEEIRRRDAAMVTAQKMIDKLRKIKKKK